MNYKHTIFLFLCLGMAACKQQAAPSAATVAIPVDISVIQATTVKDVLELDGLVAPLQTVNLVARVSGYLDAIHFKDGDSVKRGQLLFVIERAPYIEQVKLNQAKLDQAKTDYKRQTELLKENATSQASVDTSLSNLQQAQAAVKLSQINLDYTEIRAPFDGVIGRRFVDVGNFVGATPGGTVLANVMQISPAYVNAAVGERDALRLRPRITASGKSAQSAVGKTVVKAYLQGESKDGETGVLDFIDHQTGQTSGTVALRGRFENASHHLLPGFYAKLSIDLGGERSVLVVPQSILENDQQGDFVYVIDANNVAHRRTLTTADLPNERKEVLSGLKAGERVVTNGFTRLTDGKTVQLSDAHKTGEAP